MAKAQPKKGWEPLSSEAGFDSRNREYEIVLDPMQNTSAFPLYHWAEIGQKKFENGVEYVEYV